MVRSAVRIAHVSCSQFRAPGVLTGGTSAAHVACMLAQRWDDEPTGEISQPVLAGLLEEPAEPTGVISAQVLDELRERCKPTPFVVTIRSPQKPAVADDEPALIVSRPPPADEQTYASRLATVLVSCVITCGFALVVGMLVS